MKKLLLFAILLLLLTTLGFNLAFANDPKEVVEKIINQSPDMYDYIVKPLGAIAILVEDIKINPNYYINKSVMGEESVEIEVAANYVGSIKAVPSTTLEKFPSEPKTYKFYLVKINGIWKAKDYHPLKLYSKYLSENMKGDFYIVILGSYKTTKTLQNRFNELLKTGYFNNQDRPITKENFGTLQLLRSADFEGLNPAWCIIAAGPYYDSAQGFNVLQKLKFMVPELYIKKVKVKQ